MLFSPKNKSSNNSQGNIECQQRQDPMRICILEIICEILVSETLLREILLVFFGR